MDGMATEMWPAIIQAFWIVGTLITWVAVFGLIFWVGGWGIRFRFWQTETGLVIWCFSLGLLLLVVNNILGGVGGSTRGWWEPSPNYFEWWYFTRFVTVSFIFWSIVRMLRILHKHWKSREGININVPVREPKPRTSPTPTVRSKD